MCLLDEYRTSKLHDVELEKKFLSGWYWRKKKHHSECHKADGGASGRESSRGEGPCRAEEAPLVDAKGHLVQLGPTALFSDLAMSGGRAAGVTKDTNLQAGTPMIHETFMFEAVGNSK